MRSEFGDLFIGGQFVSPADGGRIDAIDPSTGEPWAQVAMAGSHDVDRAVMAAREAFEDWRVLTPSDRGRLLMRLADRIETEASEIAKVDSRDNGKPITQCLGDARNAAAWLRYYGGAADKVEGGHFRLSDDEWVLTIGEPLGVIGAITPWNYPVMAAAFKIGPALATGNTLVLKPSEVAACSTLALAELMSDVGIPPGVVNIVPGYGDTAGSRLVSNPDVAKISFTGSVKTAQDVGTSAIRDFKKLTIEAGGKAPFVVFSDVDVDRVVEAAVGGMFVNAGQQCTVASRVLVHRSIFDVFVDRYVRRVKQLRVGDPRDPGTEVGAIASESQRDKVLSYLHSAKEDGATTLLGGSELEPGDDSLRNGYWIEPTVLVDVDVNMQVYREEIFGPVVCLLPFDDETEAVKLANDTQYGLVAGVWTKDVGRAQRVARQIKAGMVWVNTYRRHHPNLPQGGTKQSGYGRENGMEALRAYTEPKSIVIDGRI